MTTNNTFLRDDGTFVGPSGGGPRPILTAATTFFFSNSGNDATGTGTLANPYLTIQRAYNVFAQTFDTGGQTITFSPTAAGSTFNAGLIINQPWSGGGSIVIDGINTSTFLNDSIDSGIRSNVPLPGSLFVQNIKLAGPTSCINLQATGVCFPKNIVCGQAGDQIVAAIGGYIQFTGSVTVVTSNNGTCMRAARNGIIDMNGQTLTFNGTISYGTAGKALAFARNAGQILNGASPTPTVIGSVTGQRYLAQANGLINTNGGGINYFPGTVAGTTDTGGQYLL